MSDFPTTSIRGLPGPLPPGETLLWQGAPAWRSLARHAFHLRGLACYFTLVLAARAAVVAGAGGSFAEAVLAALWLAPVALAPLALILLFAWLIGRTTVYTITDRRLVLHIGIALPITFNLPFRGIAGAALRAHPDGTGDIPLQLKSRDRIAFLHLWPHARPWRLRHPEPMLRAVPDAAKVADLLADAVLSATPAATGIARGPVRAEAPRPLADAA